MSGPAAGLTAPPIVPRIGADDSSMEQAHDPSSEPPAGAQPRDVFVAAQPIFDQQLKVFRHELLFRSGPENYFPAGTDARRATSSVISHGLGMIGLDALTAGTRAFINLPRNLLVDDFAFILPASRVVIELLETIEPDDEVLDACHRLHTRGYQLALDDFVDSPAYKVMLQFADYVKVDFVATPEAEWTAIARRLIPRGIRMLAEKVETQAEVNGARKVGYRYFQGYFFAKPVMVAAKDVPGFRLNYLRLLRELNRSDLNFDQIEALVRQELSISYRVLRAINSAAFGLRSEVKSIRQALVLLGSDQMRKWACVWGLAGLGQDKPAELIVETLRRARFCEILGEAAQIESPLTEPFLVGLFSTIDAIVGRPKDEILDEIAIHGEVREGILGGANVYGTLLRCAVACERGDWEVCAQATGALGLTEAQVSEGLLAATEFAHRAYHA